MELSAPAPLSLVSLALNLGLAVLLSLFVAWYYVRFGQSLSNRSQFAPIIPMLALVTVLVISVVKSSLALSLGLVGALSIVRFRTAIKDPEELIFLFFAISIGLGLGADQRIPTILAVIVIMIYLFLRKSLRLHRGASHSIYLNIDVDSEQAGSATFTKINQLLTDLLPQVDLRRMDHQVGHLGLTYYITLRNSELIASLMDQLKQEVPGCSVSLVEQNNMLGG
jgi:flagellar biogenesis protein FliO